MNNESLPGEAKMKAEMNKEHENEPRSEYGNLPPELKATQKMMDAMFGGYPVFGAVIAAPQDQAIRKPVSGAEDVGAAHEGQPDSLVTSPKNSPPAGAAPRRMDIETEIMRAPGFDYLLASEIFAALQRRLEVEYEDNLNTEIAERMQKLAKSFDHVTG